MKTTPETNNDLAARIAAKHYLIPQHGPVEELDRTIVEALQEAYIAGYRDAQKGDDPEYEDGLGS